MTREELARRQLGENLDQLMTLDPRGYGASRILYDGARRYTGEPLSMHAAEGLVSHIQKGDIVYIVTGFVLLPWRKAEMDGIVSSMMLARFLIKAFDCKPVVIVPEESVPGVVRLAALFGMHLYDSVEEMKQYPFALSYIVFTKDDRVASWQAEELLSHGAPSVVISNEAPGRNSMGCFHNALGADTTDIEAKFDVLFEMCREQGIYNISIGDLGNEIGMRTIGDHIAKYVPYTGADECQCGCGGGILAQTAADNIITATVSDWGCNAMMAACAYLLGKPQLFHTDELQKMAMEEAARAGMLDMYGRMIPNIDGFGRSINLPLVKLMRELIVYPEAAADRSEAWFDGTIQKGYFEER